MEEITWTLTGPNGTETVRGNKSKLPHVSLQRTNDKMTDSQKEGVRVWNLMVRTLMEHGLMEEK